MIEASLPTPYELLRRVAFRVAEESFDPADAVLAATLRGEWQDLRARVREGLACRARLDAGADELDEAAVKDAANEFRYSRKILSADDTRQWLTSRGLRPSQWMDYIRRAQLRAVAGDALAEIVTAYPVSDEVVDAHLLCDAYCSGQLDQIIWTLAGRVAIDARLAGDAVEEESPRDPARLDPVDVAILDLTSDEQALRVDRLARIEAQFSRWRDRVSTPTAIAAQVRGHRLDWIRYRLALAHFADPSSAEEAVFCVRDDGMSLQEIATAAGAPLASIDAYLEDVQGELRDRLVGAGTGDVLGPLQHEGAYAVIKVEDKILPSGEEPALRTKAEESLIATTVERELNERVAWEPSR